MSKIPPSKSHAGSEGTRVPFHTLFFFLLFFLLSIFLPHTPAFAATPATCFPSTDITSGLIAWWKLDDGTGTTAADSSGNGYTATLSGGATWTSGVAHNGYALSFDGTGQATTSANITAPTTASISYWMKTTADGNIQIAFDWAPFNYWACGTDNSGLEHVQCFDNSGNDPGVESVHSINDGKWHNIVFIVTPTDETLYVDGIFNATTAYATPAAPYQQINIGHQVSGTRNATGDIDDVRVYNRALSAAEIQQIYENDWPGKMMFNGDQRVMQYCDGGNWVAMGSEPAPAGGLVGWWKLDDGSGSSAVDSSGNNNTGTLTNSPTWTSGMDDGALEFNSANGSYVSMGNIAAMNGLSAITVSAWVKSSSPGANVTEAHIVDKSGCWGSTNGGPFELETSGIVSEKTDFTVYPSGGAPANFVRSGESTTNIDDGNWHMVTGEYDGSTVSIWIDGVEENSASYPGLTLSTNTNVADIGGYCSGNPLIWNGLIDDVRVYSRALTTTEVSALYVATGGTATGDTTTGLVGWWKLDDNSLTSAADSSGWGNTGTLNSVKWTAGKIGGAALFTHADASSIDAGNPTSLQITGSLTMTAWIYMTAVNPNDADDSIVDKKTGTAGYQLKGSQDCTGSNNGDNLLLAIDNGAYTERCSTTVLQTDTWYFVAGVYNATAQTMDVYINGALDDGTLLSGPVPSSIGANTDIFRIGSSSSSGSAFNGTIDDVRVYNRALSATDIAALYNERACTSPARWAGDIIYNTDHNVMQYCDGHTWHPMGPLESPGGSGCSNPNKPAGDIVYNHDHHLMQYCNGTNWIAIGGPPKDPETGLVGWWKLDDGSSGTTPTSAADSSGNNNTGTLQNGPTWTSSGKIGNALTFNGTSSYVSVNDASPLDISGSWSVSAWVNLNSLPASGNNWWNFISKSNGGSSANYALYIENDTGSSYWEFGFDSAGTTFADYTPATINTGTWYFLTGVYDASANKVYTYLNGILEATADTTGYSPPTGNGTLGLGGLSFGHVMDGTVDDARVYNRALSAAEVWDLYLATGGT